MTDINKLIEKEAERHISQFNTFEYKEYDDLISWGYEGTRVSNDANQLRDRAFRNGCKEGASFILSLFKWRKVEEELPPSYENVIFKVNVFAKTYQSEMASIGSISVTGDYNLQIDLQKPDIIEYEVTEWKPIE
ncbi:hypothetical protein [uncultured Dysgonomonas sp.]|uniref:DUF551 domain-containing protein n=1 Tax=uncultured Dysgonomonas sp. TaxID=206096 RepID=A0A212IXF3_9BACT|nr:hypothetical protein [uncultured Dysgonomonas sp.]SBV91860.1 hypothetical protein KL86DYS1_10451 [uncultured Dysgonomonas sp.]